MRIAAAFLVAALVAPCAMAADIYDRAVAHAGRGADDLQRDRLDHPAEILRFAGIQPGMQVADFFAADGYYSELLSHIVGPKGHVLLLNNLPYDEFAKNAWKDRIEKHHLANVEHRTVDPAHMGLKEASLDAVIMVKVYHDLYWVAPEDGWPRIDVGPVLDQIARALKPGGVVLVVDHSAQPGTGASVAGKLHRMDEAYARKDFEAHGLAFVKSSDVLRRPDDQRDLISYKGPALGKTDRWVCLFRKP